jgi:hypothetical protein
MNRYFADDAEASAIARKLRGFSDNAIAWMPHLGSTHMDLICAKLDTIPYMLIMASEYEAGRRRAFPNSEIGRQRPSAGAAPELLDIPGSGAPSLPEIGAHLFSSEAAGTGCGAPPVGQRPAAVNSELAGDDVCKGEVGSAGYRSASPSPHPQE